MSFDTWLLLLITSLGISLVPGPNALLVLTHGALHGRQKALFTIMGGLLGFVIVIGLCVYGIGAILKSSVFWFAVLKWVGGLYIIWLGIKLWLSPPIVLEGAQLKGQTASSKLFRQGALSAITNPKSLLLFMAMLPQFINPDGNMFMQFLIIAITYSFTEFAAEYMFVYAASHIRPWLARVGKRFNQGFGGLFVVIGAALPLRS